MSLARALDRLERGEAPSVDDLAELADPSALPEMLVAARRRRDAVWGRTITFSPKVFLPITNLCRNRCDYCSFRRSPGEEGEWTMTAEDIERALVAGRDAGTSEALLCLGDKPEKAFGAYRKTLAAFGHSSTVDYLVWASERALALGLLPHTNAGLLTREDMIRLKAVNVSLGLMLESASDRLCEPGMPHHKAPDKRPTARLAMMRGAGELAIPFTSGILVGIGETALERALALDAIRAIAVDHGHIQEVIVQSFRARPGIPMEHAPEPDDDAVSHAIAMARLILPANVSVQAPPNLHPGALRVLLDAGINDLGGISPVTPDYINHRHAWPHIDGLRAECEANGFALKARLAIYPDWLAALPEALAPQVKRASARLEERSL